MRSELSCMEQKGVDGSKVGKTLLGKKRSTGRRRELFVAPVAEPFCQTRAKSSQGREVFELNQGLMQVGNIKPIVFQAPRRRLDHLSCGIKQQEVATRIHTIIPGPQRCYVMENAAIAKLW